MDIIKGQWNFEWIERAHGWLELYYGMECTNATHHHRSETHGIQFVCLKKGHVTKPESPWKLKGTSAMGQGKNATMLIYFKGFEWNGGRSIALRITVWNKFQYGQLSLQKTNLICNGSSQYAAVLTAV
ncbi:hypothetical protein OH492_27650 [Vibrio chagasii]|nr:hypothetical protein [Vibrio chagasii]